MSESMKSLEMSESNILPHKFFTPENDFLWRNEKIDLYSMYIRELQAKVKLNPLKSKDFKFFQVTPENLVFYVKIKFF